MRDWWHEPSDYAWLVQFWHLRGLLTAVRWVTGLQGAGVAAAAVWMFNERLFQPHLLSTSVLAAAVAGSTGWVIRWWCGPWPDARESAAWVAVVDVAIAAATVVQADPVAALTTTPLFALPSIYIVFWHGPRASVAHGVFATITVAAMAARVMSSGLPDAVPLALSRVVIALSLVVGTLPFVQFGVWLMRTSSLESLTDPLTDLANRRGLHNYLTRNMGRLLTSAEPLCAFVIDLDAFKSINDEYGHKAGDAVIVRTAEQIRAALHPLAFVARTGGEEFVVVDLLPIDVATAMAERVRVAIELLDVPRSTASIGVAAGAISAVDQFEAIHACADEAMYAAKRIGGNQVAVGGTVAAKHLLRADEP